MLTHIGKYFSALWARLQPILKTKHFIVWLYYGLSLALSIIYLQLPLFSPEHEQQRFLYAAQISYGLLYHPGVLPKSLPQMVRSVNQHTPPPEQLATGDTQPFVPDRTVAKVSPVGMLPQVLATGTGFVLDVSPANMVYLARAFSMLAAVLAGSLILYLLPCFRWQVFYCLLLPSGFILRAGEYADPMLDTASFLYFALLVRLLHGQQRIALKHFFWFAVLSACIALSKTVYLPLCFTTLILTKENFASQRQRILFQALSIGAGLLASLLWVPHAMMSAYHVDVWAVLRSFTDPAQKNLVEASVDPYGVDWGKADLPYIHFLTVAHHPLLILQKLLRTIETRWFFHASAMNFLFFTARRWVQHAPSVLERLPWVTPLLFLPFLFNQRAAPGRGVAPFALRPWQRGGLGVAIAAVYWMITLSSFIDSTGLFSPIIRGLQGCYLIALMPYFCLLVSLAKFRYSDVGALQTWLILAAIAYAHYAALGIIWKTLAF